MPDFDIYITQRVRAALSRILDVGRQRKFWELAGKLRSGRFDIPGLNVEKLHTRAGKVYSARVNIELRVIFTLKADTSGQSLVILDVDHHDDAYERVSRVNTASLPYGLELVDDQTWRLDAMPAPEDDQLPGDSSVDLTGGVTLFRIPYYVLCEPDRFVSFEGSADRYLNLSEEQEDLLGKNDCATAVQGAAGTGKTTLALFHALGIYESNPDDDIFLFTYHEELACVCRAYKVNLMGEDAACDSSGVKVLSYIDFCHRYLRAQLSTEMAGHRWIDRRESREMLLQVVDSKRRWSRSLDPDEIYGVIYSIFKGRFVPGTEMLPQDREDFARIFKDYGGLPSGFDEIMEVYLLYEEKLRKQKLKDEADLIKLGYETLKNKAVLASKDRPVWIVIDEIQDFTELEWKSILLFWENQCLSSRHAVSFPFLSGDVNQNISRSGFRWQELNSYIESILRKLHRPNALRKVQLHHNFRNTRPIFELGAFVRSLDSDSPADLGVPPSHFGPKPVVVIGRAEEFHSFVETIRACRDGPPLVILAEDETLVRSLRRTRVDPQLADEGAFILPLAASKGMEFEDVVLYRLFSSLSDSLLRDDPSGARLFDLWYMGVTRARRGLVLFMTPDDLLALKELLRERFEDFRCLVEFCPKPALDLLLDFHGKRERHIPNYNVIFLELRLASELWQEYLRIEEGRKQKSTSDKDPEDDDLSRHAAACRDGALKLWQRCLDYKSLGRALFELERFEEAAPYLCRAGLLLEGAYCLVVTGDYAGAAAIYEKELCLEDAARCCEHMGDFVRAGELYERMDNWMLAAESYASAGEFNRAAECCQKAGMYRSAAEIYRARSDYLKAAELFLKAEDFLAAGQMYLRVKDKLDAARCFARAGQNEQAAILLEKLGRWSEAATCYEKCGKMNKAAQLYSKSGDLVPAAIAYESCGELLRAAELYEKARDFARAGELFARSNSDLSAARCFEAAGQWDHAVDRYRKTENKQGQARCLEQMGELAEAAELFAECGDHKDAAYCYERLQMWPQAADHYLKSQNLPLAAAALSRMGRCVDAARLYLLSGHTAQAMEICRSSEACLTEELLDWACQSKRPELKAIIHEFRHEYDKAAELFEHCLMLSRAAQCYEKLSQHRRAADLYLRDGNHSRAAECYKRCRCWQEAARCLESLRKWDDAAVMYERCEDAEGVARCRNAVRWL